MTHESELSPEQRWGDLAPIRPLMWTLIAAQALGAAAGGFVQPVPGWFESLWLGAAAASLPGFVAGLAVQAWRHPGSLGEHAGAVRRMGFIAAALGAYAAASAL